jgi:hypothetical protein
MKITLEMFKYMGSSLEMHPRFLDFVFGFAQKSSSQDEIFVSLSRKDTYPTAFGRSEFRDDCSEQSLTCK